MLSTNYLDAARQITLRTRIDTLSAICSVCLLLPALWWLVFLTVPDLRISLSGRHVNLLNLGFFIGVCFTVRLALLKPGAWLAAWAPRFFLVGSFFVVCFGALNSGFGLRAVAFSFLIVALVYSVFYFGIQGAKRVFVCSLALPFFVFYAEQTGAIASASPASQPHEFVVSTVLLGQFLCIHFALSNFESRFEQLSALLSDQRHALTAILARLQGSLEKKHSFTRTLSHGTRTPLAGIQFALSLIAKEKLSVAVARRTYAGLARNAHRLRMMTQQLGLAVMIRNRCVPTDSASFCSSSFQQALLSRFSDEAASRSIELRWAPSLHVVSLHWSLNVFVAENALAILVDNALKQQQGGVVTVGIDLLPASDALSQSYLRFSVIDEGALIAENDVPQLFLPFFQLSDRQVDQGSDGLGLGLSVVRALCESVGGRWGYEAQAAGSLFWFSLPCSAFTALNPRVAA